MAEEELKECPGCGRDSAPEDFFETVEGPRCKECKDELDAEFDSTVPPGTICEHCNELATICAPNGDYLCEDHFNDYIDGAGFDRG